MQNRSILEISWWKQKLSWLLVKTFLYLTKGRSGFPFKEQRLGSRLIRSFSKDTLQEDMVWHRDRHNRLMKPLNDTDWFFQLDNELPEPMKRGKLIFIPRNVYHRAIVGNQDLIVEIHEIE